MSIRALVQAAKQQMNTSTVSIVTTHKVSAALPVLILNGCQTNRANCGLQHECKAADYSILFVAASEHKLQCLSEQKCGLQQDELILSTT